MARIPLRLPTASRRLMAWIAMLALLFAQDAAALHAGSASMISGPVVAAPTAPDAATTVRDASPMPCHGHGDGDGDGVGVATGAAGVANLAQDAVPAANACEVHCTDLTSSGTAPDLPPAAPAPALRAQAFASPRPPSADAAPPGDVRGASPPLRLAYGRLLI
jgi:hypothetical protein